MEKLCGKKCSHPLPGHQGFTLVELLITMAVSLLVMGIIHIAYRVYQHQYTTQSQVVEMQESIRSAMNFMMDDIRMAGYNPPKLTTAGIISATANSLRFTMDVSNAAGTATDGDGIISVNEDITFSFIAGADADNNGIADSGAAQFVMTNGLKADGTRDVLPIADNISAVEFFYTFMDGTTGVAPVSPYTAADIRSVTITLLAQAGLPDREYTDNRTYQRPSGAPDWPSFGDNFRRRLLTATVKCRNMGLL